MKQENFALARQRLLRQALELGWRVTTHRLGSRLGIPLTRPYVELPLGEENDQIRAYIGPRKIRFSSAGLSESVDSGLEMRGLTIIDLKDAIQRHV